VNSLAPLIAWFSRQWSSRIWNFLRDARDFRPFGRFRRGAGIASFAGGPCPERGRGARDAPLTQIGRERGRGPAPAELSTWTLAATPRAWLGGATATRRIADRVPSFEVKLGSRAVHLDKGCYHRGRRTLMRLRDLSDSVAPSARGGCRAAAGRGPPENELDAPKAGGRAGVITQRAPEKARTGAHSLRRIGTQ